MHSANCLLVLLQLKIWLLHKTISHTWFPDEAVIVKLSVPIVYSHFLSHVERAVWLRARHYRSTVQVLCVNVIPLGERHPDQPRIVETITIDMITRLQSYFWERHIPKWWIIWKNCSISIEFYISYKITIFLRSTTPYLTKSNIY